MRIFLQPGVIGGRLETTQCLEKIYRSWKWGSWKEGSSASYNVFNFPPPDTYCASLEGIAWQ